MKYIKQTLFVALTFSLLFPLTSLAHAVQVAYCVSCTGNLRLYVEHWHGTADPSAEMMTVSVTIDSVTTQQTIAPVASHIGVLFNDLPDCATSLTSFTSCDRANTHNDWVVYDFSGAVAGSVVNLSIPTATNQLTDDCNGTMYPASTGNFTFPTIVIPDTIADITAYRGVTVASVVFSLLPNVTYNWTNDNPAIGLPASGTGNTPSFVSSVDTTTQVANIVVNDGCHDNAFTITILSASDSLTVGNDVTIQTISNSFKVYPTPTSGNLKVEYTLNAASNVQISLLDSRGILVDEILADNKSIGSHVVSYEMAGMASGSYFIQLKTNNSFLVKKVVKF